jgi:hypothetical protein
MMWLLPIGYFPVVAFSLISIFFFPSSARSTDESAWQSANPKVQLMIGYLRSIQQK